MIILIGSLKGGCGKSTTAVNICAALVRDGHDVVLVDADSTVSTSAKWAADRGETDLPLVHCVQKYENIRETLLDLDRRYEFVIVDTAGKDSRELRTGMCAAHILIVPFRPSQPDLDTLPNMASIVQQARDINPQLRVVALITMSPTNPGVLESNDAREILSDYPDFKLLRTMISDRKVYRDAMSEGLGVVEMNNSKAAGEFEVMLNEVLKKHG